MFERRSDKLLSWPQFARRMARVWLLLLALVLVALSIGVLGYRSFARLSWIDAILNASMILTGMGPVAPLTTTSAKLFASAYAIFSGVVFLTSAGLVLAPVFHRVLHKFHLDDEDSRAPRQPRDQTGNKPRGRSR